jgi:superfamily II DNA or RNA helicase
MLTTMKTYLGKKGYTIRLKDFTEEQICKIKEDLTFTPFQPKGYGPDPIPFSIFGISENKMFLPKFYGITTFGKPTKKKISNGNNIKLKFNGSLRENQIEPVQACIKAANDTGGGILCLPCAYGKTSIALYIIVELGVKALIIVNKEFLMDQWKERIQQFLPDAKIGILRQKKIDIENKDIVIAMLQSVAMCKYDSSIYDSFGITFYDEVHCVPSKIFSKALRKINTKYHFGLSATPNRADGMTKVTNLYIGPIIYKVDTRKAKKNPKNLHVFTVAFNKLPEGKHYKSLLNYKGKPDVVRMISNITQCPKRIALISMILRYFIITDKRHILVLSDRIQYLRDIEDKIKLDLSDNLPFKIGYYVGGMKEKERKESERADLILASYSMAKEAMDIPILDTLLMVTSKSNIEQSIGRIQRQTVYPDERPPLVIDFVDFFSSFQSQFNKRELFYKKNHYTISNFVFNENINKLYADFEEGIRNITINNSIDIEVEDNEVEEEDNEVEESKTTMAVNPVMTQSKIDTCFKKTNIIPCEINKTLYEVIGDGDFDI